jgi:tripartite-type tricarboxylate transporter receptor subunit TctC
MKALRLVLAAFTLALPLAAGAQPYPAKPVRVLVGYAAGSSTDIVGRVMADRLGAHWKQTVIVENRGGAAGNLAADAATPHILIVGPDFPAKSVAELIALAKAEPGKLTFASSGVGNSDHLCGELFNMMAGIRAIHVPYKGGAPAVQDVIPGRVAYYFAGMPVGLPLATSGRARALGVTSKVRYTAVPNVPTIAEQGLPQYEATLWQGFFAPATIQQELGARIASDVGTVLRQTDTRERLAKVGVALFEDNQANFRSFFAADIEKWKNLVKSTNLKLE